MYRHQTRMPTLVALFVLIFGIGGGILLIETSHQLATSADVTIAPKNIHITNVSDSQFSVSWLTDKETTGSISYTDNSSPNLTAFDDRDVDGNAKQYITHHITINNLKENTIYYFKILSDGSFFDNQGKSYEQSSGPKLTSTLSVDPAYGLVLRNDNKPAEGAIVYLTVGNSLPLSAIVKSEGTWLIPLTTARTQDLFSRPKLVDPDVIQLSVVYDGKLTSSITTDTKTASPVPTIILGKTYDFRKAQGRKGDLLARNETKANVLGAEKSSLTSPLSPTLSKSVPVQKVDILFPTKNSTTTIDTKPLIKGVGIPGAQVIVTVNSTPQVGKVTVSDDGTWSFIPPSSLPPGNHSVSATTTDAKGRSVTLTRTFVVLKSGESVLGDSTPSASLTPVYNPTEIPTVSPYLTVEPTSTSSPPVTGATSPTLIFLGAGVVFILLGIRFILFP